MRKTLIIIGVVIVFGLLLIAPVIPVEETYVREASYVVDAWSPTNYYVDIHNTEYSGATFTVTFKYYDEDEVVVGSMPVSHFIDSHDIHRFTLPQPPFAWSGWNFEVYPQEVYTTGTVYKSLFDILRGG